MSLIIDAIRKAQQLRLQELRGTPFFREPGPNDEKRGPGRKRFWILAAAGSSIALLLVVLLLGKTFYPLVTFHGGQEVSLIEKKEPAVEPPGQKDLQEPSRKDLATGQIHGSPASMEAFVEKTTQEPLKEQVAEPKKIVKLNPLKTMVAEARSTPPARAPEEPIKKTPPVPKEEVLSESIGEGSTINPLIRTGSQEPSKNEGSASQVKESLSPMEPFPEKEREGPLKKQVTEEKEIVEVKSHKNVVTEPEPTAPTPSSDGPIKETASSPEEEVLSESRAKGAPVRPVIGKGFVEPLEREVPTHQIEEPPSAMEPSVEEEGVGPLRQEVTEEKEIVKVEPHKNVVTLPRPTAPTPSSDGPIKETAATPEEEVFPQSLGKEQEDGEDKTLASDVLASFNLGVSFYDRGEIVKAIQAYKKAVALNPAYIEAYNNLGIIYQKIGDLDRALSAYQKSIDINPRYEKAYNNLGIVLYLKGRYEEAIEAFQNALAINPTNIESHINLGIVFKKQGQLGKAVESYQKALAINPLHGETHYNIALLYEQLENIELAMGHYQKFIQLSSKTRPDLVSKVKRHLNYLMEIRKHKRG